MNSPMERRAALLIGLVVGHLAGLLSVWILAPIEVVNTYPALLRADHRHEWVRMVALSYAADQDLERAHNRLEGLAQQDIQAAMTALIEAYAASGQPAETLRRLAVLADALDVHTPAMLAYLHVTPVPPTPVPPPSLTPTPSPLPTPLLTPIPIHTAVPTAVPTPSPPPTQPISPMATPTADLLPGSPAPMQVIEKELVCEPGLPPRIEVVVEDEKGKGVAGTELWLTWPGGADRAVTGLKPRQGQGFADFDAQPETVYTLSASQLGRPLLSDLRLERCPVEPESPPDAEDEGTGTPTPEEEEQQTATPEAEVQPLWGSWRIVLAPPDEDT